MRRLVFALLLTAGGAGLAQQQVQQPRIQQPQPQQPQIQQRKIPQQQAQLNGRVHDVHGAAIPDAILTVNSLEVHADAAGTFQVALPLGLCRIRVQAPHYSPFTVVLELEEDRDLDVQLSPGSRVEVHAEPDVLSPDPSTYAYTRSDLLPANPGRPGVPFSIPGIPTETASGGIKAPQYFAPGVAGDHGEPIAQFFDIGGFLFNNNLTANAHGNGYADPNIVIPQTLGGVLVDSAAFNARYGDHSINLAISYPVQPRLTSFVQASSDGRDGDLAAGWSPRNPQRNAWLAFEASFGNGFLARPEERQQYKLDSYWSWTPGSHRLTLFGLGYYGFSRIPGLIPLHTPVLDDTIDPRQSDLTHTALGLLTDGWQIDRRQVLQSSAYVRTYSLALQSNFGDGLIRQSEFRTVIGGNVTYTFAFNPRWTLLAGFDLRRDAPRGLDLSRADAIGIFQPVTSNDLTILHAAPFAAVNAIFGRNLQLYLGLRYDQIHFLNRDFIHPANSFDQFPGMTSPKINLTLGRADAPVLPAVSFSFGKAFHANDPRIGTGTGRGPLIIQAREYQLLVSKIVHGTELRLTLAHITNSAELAKIDPDTGLQEDVGPSLNQFVTVAVRRRYSRGFLQASYAQANAVLEPDIAAHQPRQPAPEAPRLIVDAIGTVDRLPWHLTGKTEYEYVGEKPLGDNFHAVPIREIRLDLARSFADGRWLVSVNGQLSQGASGQTLETFALPGEPFATERIVGVPLRSYANLSLTYRFGN